MADPVKAEIYTNLLLFWWREGLCAKMPRTVQSNICLTLYNLIYFRLGQYSFIIDYKIETLH